MIERAEKIRAEIKETYRDRCKKSEAFLKIQQNIFPGGIPRNLQFHNPFPFVIERGEGSKVLDLDGNEYIDYCNNFSSLILGHSHPKVLEAVNKQMDKGTVHSNPTPIQYELAELLCNRVPSMEQLRFVNSGTEACMWAMRLARAFTGKSKIMKMEGGYHGLYDGADISVHPSLEKAGSSQKPLSVPDDLGLLSNAVQETIVAPFNDKRETQVIFEDNLKDLAAVIVEPMLGSCGMIPPQNGYLEFLRELTARNKVILIFDEVITLRFASGGAQDRFKIMPDLCMLGKIIGGGFPVGAFGGRQDIMALVSPMNNYVAHSGTFSANSITMAAGLVTLKELTPDLYKQLDAKGDFLRGKANALFKKLGINGQVTGMSSCFAIHFTGEPIRNYRQVALAKDDVLIPSLLNLSLLNRGIYLSKKGSGFISVMNTDKEIESFLTALEESIREILPVIEEETPEVMVNN
jgi:glutamate-1-semialdehyde 2,1-aminomutase